MSSKKLRPLFYLAFKLLRRNQSFELLTARTNDNNNTDEALNGANISTIDRVNRTLHIGGAFSPADAASSKNRMGGRESAIAADSLALLRRASEHANTADHTYII